MLLSTTPTIEGRRILEYKGVVTGETIVGANVLKDFMASLSDFFGGRSGTYEKVLRGIDLDYETIGQGGSMLMVTCSGTAVVI